MKNLRRLLPLILSLCGVALFAQEITLSEAVASKDYERLIAIYKTSTLDASETATVIREISAAKQKFRKAFMQAVFEKKATDTTVGSFLQNELMRLIKEKEVEDDVEYTKLCLKVAAINSASDIIFAIAPYLVHPRETIRAEANAAVAAKKDERIFLILSELIAKENNIDKIYAMETLMALKDDRAVPALLQELANPNKSVRFFALKAIEAIGSDKAQYAVIEIAQKDADEEMRLKAVSVLRLFKTSPVFYALQNLVKDANLSVRAKALDSALEQKNKRFASALSEGLAREVDAAQKLALLQGLIALSSGGGMKGIYTILKNETSENLLVWALYTCNKIGDKGCDEHLLRLLETRKEDAIQIECVLGLSLRKQQKHLAALFAVLSDTQRSAVVRSAAIASIAAFDTEASILPLFTIYEREKEPNIRAQMRVLFVNLMQAKLKKL